MDDLKSAVALFAVVVEHLEKVSYAHRYETGVTISRTCKHFVEALENDVLPQSSMGAGRNIPPPFIRDES